MARARDSWSYGWGFEPLLSWHGFIRPIRLVVRTLPFHGNNTGSNPVWVNKTIFYSYWIKNNLCYFLLYKLFLYYTQKNKKLLIKKFKLENINFVDFFYVLKIQSVNFSFQMLIKPWLHCEWVFNHISGNLFISSKMT